MMYLIGYVGFERCLDVPYAGEVMAYLLYRIATSKKQR